MATETNRTTDQATGWVGWIFFASIMMMLEGGFQIIDGLVAIFRNNFFLVHGRSVVVFNVTAWGWINFSIGIITVLAAMALMRGALWARMLAIFLAGLSLLANIAFLPAYPIWSIAVGLMDVLVIYAVAMHGNELKA
jgi:hypothetical protein